MYLLLSVVNGCVFLTQYPKFDTNVFMSQPKQRIGFIGQGWIGKNYANDFEARGYEVVRYALENEYVMNKEKISECDIVFIAVPTPTTQKGFDDSILRSAIALVGKGKIAVIKSTILPGTTESIQRQYPQIYVTHSPEFLREVTAGYDAAHPDRNIVGIPVQNKKYQDAAKSILAVLPKAPFEKVMAARDAEFVKYASNCFLFTKVMFTNVLYDLVQAKEGNWDDVKEAFVNDPRVGKSHNDPIHHTGRGAGGNCFIKDFEAFRRFYEKEVGKGRGSAMLDALRDMNIDLLVRSKKDIHLLMQVYPKLVNSKSKKVSRKKQ